MSLGFKRSRSIGGQTNEPSLHDRADAGSLFEKEWDELVIRFDEESHRYRVGTASQPIDPHEDRPTAKSKP